MFQVHIWMVAVALVYVGLFALAAWLLFAVIRAGVAAGIARAVERGHLPAAADPQNADRVRG